MNKENVNQKIKDQLRASLEVLHKLKRILEEKPIIIGNDLEKEKVEYLAKLLEMHVALTYYILCFSNIPDDFIKKYRKLNEFLLGYENIEELRNKIDNFLQRKITILDFPCYFIKYNISTDLMELHIKDKFNKKCLQDYQEYLGSLFLSNFEINLIYNLAKYQDFLEKKLKELELLKQQLEEFLKEETLKKFSEKYQEESKSLSIKIFIVGGLSFIILILAGALITWIITDIPNSKQLNYAVILTKFGLAAFFGTLSFYFIKYAIKLSERQDEYRYKALVLSTFPALNAFLQDDEKRFELIQTLILENQKLQTLLGSKDDKLPIEELIQLLNLLKDKK